MNRQPGFKKSSIPDGWCVMVAAVQGQYTHGRYTHGQYTLVLQLHEVLEELALIVRTQVQLLSGQAGDLCA